MSTNITQNAQDASFNRFGNNSQNAIDSLAYKNAFATLQNKRASKKAKKEAIKTIEEIQQRRKAQMTDLVNQVLMGHEGIILSSVEEGTGVYDSANGVVTEYTSEVKLKVKRGKEQEAKQLMAILAEALKQDAYIVADENAVKTAEELETITDKDTKDSYAPMVMYEADHAFTPEEVADLSSKLVEKNIGCTIVGNTFESTNYNPDMSEEKFRNEI